MTGPPMPEKPPLRLTCERGVFECDGLHRWGHGMWEFRWRSAEMGPSGEAVVAFFDVLVEAGLRQLPCSAAERRAFAKYIESQATAQVGVKVEIDDSKPLAYRSVPLRVCDDGAGADRTYRSGPRRGRWLA